MEVAGVVLGALPVIERAIRYYRDRSSILWHHERFMVSLLRSFQFEHLLFRTSCQKLLEGCVDRWTMEELLMKPDEARWKKVLDEDLDSKLKRRLGEDYSVYVHAIQDMWRHLVKLCRILRLKDYKTALQTTDIQNSGSSMEIWHRIKDCLRLRENEHLLAQVSGANRRLEQLVGIMPNSLSRGRESTQTVIDRLHSTRKIAVNLHCALHQSFRCQCPSHEFHLRLKDHMDSDETTDIFEGAILVRSAPVASTPTAPGRCETWRKVQVTSQGATTVGAGPCTATTRTTVALKDSLIADLCAATANISGSNTCIGYLEESGRKHYIHAMSSGVAEQYNKKITLHEMLLGQSQPCSGNSQPSLHLRDQLELAHLLACSLLQLNFTPWLKGRWSAHDVNLLSAHSPLWLQNGAFVSARFPDVATATPALATKTWRACAVPNEAVFALGKIMLELHMKALLDDKTIDDDRSSIPDTADYQAAKRLCEQVQWDCLPGWLTAMTTCINRRFRHDMDFENEDFRVEFYTYVVEPLRETLQIATATKAPKMPSR
ncbi:hypothetical protein BDZ85DRAFT_58810 [Elsinoe ampelina]|uniref:DUF7580 domain-containing protein n=1 Tax=Elsinoe ampelina TaxID=302913 RepID=A0A6A6GN10_9PEZI|nr:hypothetical protein BDZ85DRAFT_58810 [Elsinoe ampelina]